jgi:hypothetical protein
MEPVIFPTTIAPVIQTDRVKRAKPRKDTGRDSGFSKQLRREQENPVDPQPAPEEDAEDAPAAAGEADPESPGARRLPRDDGRAAAAFKKLIDVRV